MFNWYEEQTSFNLISPKNALSLSRHVSCLARLVRNVVSTSHRDTAQTAKTTPSKFGADFSFGISIFFLDLEQSTKNNNENHSKFSRAGPPPRQLANRNEFDILVSFIIIYCSLSLSPSETHNTQPLAEEYSGRNEANNIPASSLEPTEKRQERNSRFLRIALIMQWVNERKNQFILSSKEITHFFGQFFFYSIPTSAGVHSLVCIHAASSRCVVQSTISNQFRSHVGPLHPFSEQQKKSQLEIVCAYYRDIDYRLYTYRELTKTENNSKR